MPNALETRLTEQFGVRDPLASAGTNQHEPWRQGSHAIVVGGSIAGLLAAKVLLTYYTHVSIIDRDVLPDHAGHAPGRAAGES